jgi:hypothetical protein
MFQQEIQLRLNLRVPMNPFRYDFFCSSRFQLPHLSVQVLSLLFAQRAAGKTVNLAHIKIPFCKIKVQSAILHFFGFGKPHFCVVCGFPEFGNENM